MDKVSPHLLLMDKPWLQPAGVCSSSSQWVWDATDGTYHLLLFGLSHNHIQAPAMSLFILPHTETEKCSRLA